MPNFDPFAARDDREAQKEDKRFPGPPCPPGHPFDPFGEDR